MSFSFAPLARTSTMKFVAVSSACGGLAIVPAVSAGTLGRPFWVSSSVSALKFWFTPTTLNWYHSAVWCWAPRSLAIERSSIDPFVPWSPTTLTHALRKSDQVSPM